MGKTYAKVLELLNNEVPSKISRYAFCKRTGINPTAFDRYKAGISEPNQATLERLADYFDVSVESLRGASLQLTINGEEYYFDWSMAGITASEFILLFDRDTCQEEFNSCLTAIIARVLRDVYGSDPHDRERMLELFSNFKPDMNIFRN